MKTPTIPTHPAAGERAAYLGFDAETTALTPKKFARDGEQGGILVEIGMVAYNKRLQPIAQFSRLVNANASLTDRAAGRVNAVVEKMHTDNSLWHDLATVNNPANTTPAAVESAAIEWVESNGFSNLPMLGSSITLDRMFLAAEMPALLDKFHYRSVDATTLCLLSERSLGISPHECLPAQADTCAQHRVIADVERSALLVRTCLHEFGCGDAVESDEASV